MCGKTPSGTANGDGGAESEYSVCFLRRRGLIIEDNMEERPRK